MVAGDVCSAFLGTDAAAPSTHMQSKGAARSRMSTPEANAHSSAAEVLLTHRDRVRTMTAMARTVVTHVTDDLDGSKDAEEVRFALHGAEYSIDLSKKNRAALEKALQPYIDAGTKTSGRRSTSRRGPSSTSTRRDLKAVREWAKEQGLEVSERGRIPASILEQYDNR